MVLNWVFGSKTKPKRKAGAPKKPAYEKAREIAAKGSDEERRKLAEHEDLEPEILYYFATDKSVDVRKAVAINRGTPLQADRILAEDTDENVRIELANKIGRLVPELDSKENARLAEMVIEILEILARDEMPRVRAVIAEELKNADNVPKSLVLQLASDLEDIVAAPVLEYSPMLNQADLLELLARGMRTRKVIALARRRGIDEPVSDALVAKNDLHAIGALVANKAAKISVKAFDVIAEKAEMNKDWHNAMVYRDDLPLRTILRIATFVSAALMEALVSRNQQSKEHVEGLRKAVRERIERGDVPGLEKVLNAPQNAPVNVFGAEPDETPGKPVGDPVVQRVKKDREMGVLSEAHLVRQLDKQDLEYVKAALIELSDLPSKAVNQMLGTRTAKAVLAISWKAGLSIKMAVRLQLDLAKVNRADVMRAGDDGGYPMSEADLDWYVESFR
ncbi:MAG: hypothetical protein K0Q70_1042 [Rhodospirillales bacterium]|nr:hypothetical protein [Rhodospirillales bacterium]